MTIDRALYYFAWAAILAALFCLVGCAPIHRTISLSMDGATARVDETSNAYTTGEWSTGMWLTRSADGATSMGLSDTRTKNTIGTLGGAAIGALGTLAVAP